MQMMGVRGSALKLKASLFASISVGGLLIPAVEVHDGSDYRRYVSLQLVDPVDPRQRPTIEQAISQSGAFCIPLHFPPLTCGVLYSHSGSEYGSEPHRVTRIGNSPLKSHGLRALRLAVILPGNWRNSSVCSSICRRSQQSFIVPDADYNLGLDLLYIVLQAHILVVPQIQRVHFIKTEI